MPPKVAAKAKATTKAKSTSVKRLTQTGGDDPLSRYFNPSFATNPINEPISISVQPEREGLNILMNGSVRVRNGIVTVTASNNESQDYVIIVALQNGERYIIRYNKTSVQRALEDSKRRPIERHHDNIVDMPYSNELHITVKPVQTITLTTDTSNYLPNSFDDLTPVGVSVLICHTIPNDRKKQDYSYFSHLSQAFSYHIIPQVKYTEGYVTVRLGDTDDSSNTYKINGTIDVSPNRSYTDINYDPSSRGEQAVIVDARTPRGVYIIYGAPNKYVGEIVDIIHFGDPSSGGGKKRAPRKRTAKKIA